MKILATSILFTMISAPALASHMEVCGVTAEVTSFKDLTKFIIGSDIVPAGINQDGQAIDTFVNTMSFQVNSITTEFPDEECDYLLGQTYQVVLTKETDISEINAGDQIRLTRSLFSAMTPNGASYSEKWNFTE